MNKRKPEGRHFYEAGGFTKQLLIHVSKAVHSKLIRLARKRGESLQLTVRGLIERGAASSSGPKK